MIDPSYWKQELRRQAKQLDGYIGRSVLGHQSKARLERLLMQGYFLLHKLMEDHRIDDAIAGTVIPMSAVQSAGRTVYLGDYQKLHKTLAEISQDQVSYHLSVLANKIIHSYLILPIIEEGKGLQRVAICSEFEHFDKVLVVPLETLITPLRSLR